MNDEEVVDLFKNSRYKLTSPQGITRLPDTDISPFTPSLVVYQPLVVLMDGFSYFIDLPASDHYGLSSASSSSCWLSVRRLPGPDALNRPQRHSGSSSSPTRRPQSPHTPVPHLHIDARSSVFLLDVDRDAPFRSRRAIALRVSQSPSAWDEFDLHDRLTRVYTHRCSGSPRRCSGDPLSRSGLHPDLVHPVVRLTKHALADLRVSGHPITF
jgi:hypothetical protein